MNMLGRRGQRLRTRISRRTSVLAAVALALPLAVVGITSASAVDTTFGPYNIDGVVPDGNVGAAIADPSGSTKELGPLNSSTTKIGVIHNDAVPTLGQTNPNGQVDLNQVWLNLQRVGTGTTAKDWLYFAWHRDANSGSGFIAYEFMKNAAPVACDYSTKTEAQLVAGCNPFANRAAGDFLILWDQQGGSRALTLRTWSGTAPNLTLSAGVTLNGAVSSAQYSADGFYGEAAVNLTDALNLSTTSCLTIANTIPSTVTGNSDTADYKDTVLTRAQLSTCAGVNLKKVDDSTPAQVLAGATFTLYNNADPVASLGPEDAVTTSTCTTGSDGLCSIPSVSFGEYWAVETVTPANYDTAAPQRVTVGSGGSSPVLLTFIDPRQRGSILVNKRVGTATGSLLDGAGFTATGSGGFSAVMPSTATGVFCLDDLLYGTYTVTESTVPAGYTGAPAQQVTVSTKSTCANRSTTPDATFTNNPAPGTINLVKTDDATPGNPLGGAKFTLFVDDDGTYQAATDTVVQAGPTQTASNGTLSFTQVPLGRYCVVETTTPTGYSTADPQCVTVGLGSAVATGQTISLNFVDPRLHRVIVLVCHEGSNTLDPSPVTIGTTTGLTSLATPPAGFTDAQLCALGGATVGGLPHGSVSASVNVAH